MSLRTIRRRQVEEAADSRPAAAPVDAMCAVLEDDPDRPILLVDGVYVRAGYLVAALAPEALERATAQQSIRAGAVRRIGDYTSNRGGTA